MLRLQLSGEDRNIDLEIIDTSRKLATDVPEVITDLVEIAAYIYCADQQIPRGGEGVANCGANWRRPFISHIPVRMPDIWSDRPILDALRKTLSFWSEDTYDFHFSKLTNPVPMQQYLKFEDSEPRASDLDEVILFSGGLDSLGGAVKEVVREQRRVTLVTFESQLKSSGSASPSLRSGISAIGIVISTKFPSSPSTPMMASREPCLSNSARPVSGYWKMPAKGDSINSWFLNSTGSGATPA